MYTTTDRRRDGDPVEKAVNKKVNKKFGRGMLIGAIVVTVILVIGAVLIGIFVESIIGRCILIIGFAIGIIVMWVFAIKDLKTIKRANNA